MPSVERSLAPVTALAPRAVRRSRASLRGRLERLRQRLFFIGQCAVAAAFAWWFAISVLHHQRPFFAPVAAIVCLGMSFGNRLRRVAEVAIGVAIGDAFVHLVGTGVWQIAVIVLVSMTLAVLLDAGLLLVIQAGVQSVVVATVVTQPGGPVNRWIDAAVGGLVALVVTTIVPAAPLIKPRVEAAAVIAELASLLSSTARALRRHDQELARTTLQRARASDQALEGLRELSAEGIAVIRLSPFRRRLPVRSRPLLADVARDTARRGTPVALVRGDPGTGALDRGGPAHADRAAERPGPRAGAAVGGRRLTRTAAQAGARTRHSRFRFDDARCWASTRRPRARASRHDLVNDIASPT